MVNACEHALWISGNQVGMSGKDESPDCKNRRHNFGGTQKSKEWQPLGDKGEIMNKAGKRQAIEAAELLKSTHTLVKRMLDAKKYDAVLELLEQCQGCAISLGEKIEAEEGEKAPTIPLLEHYCETIYQNYEKLRQRLKVSSSQLHKELDRELNRIHRSIEEDIPARTEAVFLPYKASMWDSLESIWKAADEDPTCDAYVIPIPYYDKNPDGSFERLHYEGDQYPEDVPITHYQDYPFAERHPDLVFIHNPYDEYNYLTSVHPFFYAKNLKQFTEKLVYVPYFILGEPDPNNPDSVEQVSHFCTTPGVIWADQVIVQSEAMRQVYIKVMTDYMKDQGLTREYWEKKILGLGSPKVDKVLSTDRKDQTLPKEWRRIIEKPDGTLKKVILYNTSLNAFLLNTDRYLDKVRDVFRIFREEKEEVALLWRPHPLFYTTVKTMRPQFLEEYEKLAEDYRREAWGIYDDTADLDRAIAVCDAYYGDPSSVVQLCEEAGKMVMIQDVELLYDQEEESS